MGRVLEVTDRLANAAAEVARAVEPDADLHASAEYRRHLAGVLAKRVLTAARDDLNWLLTACDTVTPEEVEAYLQENKKGEYQ